MIPERIVRMCQALAEQHRRIDAQEHQRRMDWDALADEVSRLPETFAPGDLFTFESRYIQPNEMLTMEEAAERWK